MPSARRSDIHILISEGGRQLKRAIIANTAASVAAALTPGLQNAARYGVGTALSALSNPAVYRRNEVVTLPNRGASTALADRWAANYARQLGAGLGEQSAEGMLVSLRTLSNTTLADAWINQILYSVAGLPPGQSMSVVGVAQQRLQLYLASRRTPGPLDFARDVGKLYLSRRANLVVENETQVARNFGTQLTMMNAVQRGYLPTGARKVWVTAVDERVCPVCAPMDSVAVEIDSPFTVRAHHGVLRHDTQLWVPPAHPNCRCSVVPESAIEAGIITHTARFSRTKEHRARLRSQLSDLIRDATPPWAEDNYNDDLGKAFSPQLHPRGKAGLFVAGGALALAGAREAADLYGIRQQTKHGYAVSSGVVPRKLYRKHKGASDMPQGTVITQQSHPEGTYLISSASLRNYRFPPASREAGYLAALEANMGRKGFTHPVQMRIYHGDGKRAAEVWDGHHRLEIADAMGIKNVPVTVRHVEGPPPLPTKALQLWRMVNQRQYGYRLQRSN